MDKRHECRDAAADVAAAWHAKRRRLSRVFNSLAMEARSKHKVPLINGFTNEIIVAEHHTNYGRNENRNCLRMFPGGMKGLHWRRFL